MSRVGRGVLTVLLALLAVPAAKSEEVLLLQTKGSVLARRQGWVASQPVRAGAVLQETDLLELAPATEALVLCPDFETFWRPPAGLIRGAAAGCPRGPRRVLAREGRRLMAPRGAADSEDILAPRRVILESEPLLRWRSMGGARSFEVQIVREGDPDRPVWGPVLVKGLELRYPQSPAIHRLVPSTSYLVEVRTYGARDFVQAGVPFVVQELAARKSLEEALDRLRASLVEAVPQGLAVAVRLASDGVYGKALDEVDEVRERAKSAAVTLLGARFAEELGFKREAARRYGEARQEAQAESNQLVEAEALEGLARNQRDHAQAKPLYKSALDVWTALGDAEAADRVRKTLAAPK